MKTTVQFLCFKEDCGEVVEEDLDVCPSDFTAERMSDGDAIELHGVACPECDTEYEVETVSSMGGVTAKADGKDVVITVFDDDFYDSSDYDEYLSAYVPSSNSEAEYNYARDDLMRLARLRVSSTDDIVNRVVFSQMVACMEAYLSDKILRLVTDHQEIKNRVIRSADFMKNQKLLISDVLADPTMAETMFRVGLQSLSYHDLKKVEKLYTIALNNDAFPTDQILRDALDAATKIRHDCVHRNGRKLDGTRNEIDEMMIVQLVSRIDILVQHVEQKSIDAIRALAAQ